MMDLRLFSETKLRTKFDTIMNDIPKYVKARNERMQEVRKTLDSSVEMFSRRLSSTEQFYNKLKAVL